MMIKPFLTLLTGIACVSTVAFTQADEKKGSAEKKAEVKKEAAATTTLEISGNDVLQFDVKELKVKAGEKVKLKLKHSGALPKAAMGHNVVVLKAGEDIAAFATKAISAGAAADYIPSDEESTKKVIVATKMLGGGEETEVEFTAPEAGEYPFLCTFPGHYAIMNGKLIVE